MKEHARRNNVLLPILPMMAGRQVLRGAFAVVLKQACFCTKNSGLTLNSGCCYCVCVCFFFFFFSLLLFLGSVSLLVLRYVQYTMAKGTRRTATPIENEQSLPSLYLEGIYTLYCSCRRISSKCTFAFVIYSNNRGGKVKTNKSTINKSRLQQTVVYSIHLHCTVTPGAHHLKAD